MPLVPWRSIGDVSFEIWRKTILDAGGDPTLAAREYYEAVVPHSTICLGNLLAESSFGQNELTRTHNNPLGLRLRPGDEKRFAVKEYKPYGYFVSHHSILECLRYWKEKITDPEYAYAPTVSWSDFVYVYAPPSDHNDTEGYIRKTEQLFSQLGKGQAMPSKPKVLITQGHRTTGDTGAPGEEAQIIRIAPAIAAALRKAGYDVTLWPNGVQELQGTLDTAGRTAGAWCEATAGEKVHIDVHLEWSPAEGIFAIIADGAGLVTGAPVHQAATDTWDGNPGDRVLARAIVKHANRLTGIPIRVGGVREPGLMSEKQTYVGTGGGGQYPPSRLAMFAYTSPYHQSTYRLVVEHGNLQHDSEYYTHKDFPANVGAAYVAAFNEVFGVSSPGTTTTSTTAKPTTTPKPEAVYPAGMDEGIAKWLWGDGPMAREFPFHPKGKVSNAWLQLGIQLGHGELTDHAKYDDGREYFVFTSLTIWRPNGKEAWRQLGK